MEIFFLLYYDFRKMKVQQNLGAAILGTIKYSSFV